MRLLQICNVGTVLGGTGACAWSVTRSLPEIDHAVAFLGPIDEPTPAALAGIPTGTIRRLTSDIARHADLVLLHNTPAARCDRLDTPSILYRHSAGGSAHATRSVCCSKTLRDQLGLREPVLYQGVPGQERSTRSLGDGLTIGRLCTPTVRKWPSGTPAFYRRLAARHPRVHWEFVGCPHPMRPALADACSGSAVFHDAGPRARRHLSRWDAMLYSNRRLPETFGRTVAEAMLAGCLPIVDGLGGFTEQITPGTGFLCGTTEDFDHAITTIADPLTRRRFATAAMRHADRRFSHAAFGDRLRRLLAETRSGHGH